jgi:pimeloyl-ACP methyl ester carboxylesterase
VTDIETHGGRARSADGTTIAYEARGAGPVVVLVDPAGHHRGNSPFAGLAPLLAEDFTVVTYDRRGRGESTDGAEWSVEREVDDLAALIAEAGGSAFVYAFSSGGLLALHAAARGLAVPKLALFEPPIEPTDAPVGESDFTAELAELVAGGRRREAVEFFHRGIGVPDEIIDQMTPPVWAALEAVAPTLVYDCRLSDAMSLQVLRSVTVPTLVLDSQGSSPSITESAATVAAALPNGTHRHLPGDWHGVPGEVLAPALTEFFLR